MSKITNKIDTFLTERDDALAVAQEIHKKKKGKEDDIAPKVIEKALTDKLGKGGLKHFDTVKAWLKKKGYKIWVKKKLKSPFMKEAEEVTDTKRCVCTECGYETQVPTDKKCSDFKDPQGHPLKSGSAEDVGVRQSSRDKEMDSLKEAIKRTDVSKMVSVRTSGQGRKGIAGKFKGSRNRPELPPEISKILAKDYKDLSPAEKKKLIAHHKPEKK